MVRAIPFLVFAASAWRFRGRRYLACNAAHSSARLCTDVKSDASNGHVPSELERARELLGDRITSGRRLLLHPNRTLSSIHVTVAKALSTPPEFLLGLIR